LKEVVRAEAWKGVRELVADLGGDAAQILATARVEEAALADPDQYVPLRWLVDSIEIAAQRLNRLDFGLLSGLRANLSELGALTVAASNAASGRAGLEVLGRYIHVHNPALVLAISPVPGTMLDLVSIDIRTRRTVLTPQYLERGVAIIHAGLRVLCGPQYRPTAVWFRNSRLSSIADYRRIFGGEPSFEMKSLGVVVERAMLDARQPGRNSRLRALTEAYLQAIGTARDHFSARVTNLVHALLTQGACSAEEAARVLGLSKRTLQRRLSAENTCFDAIRDSVRRKLAEHLLAQPDVRLSHIADVLNYADLASFSRSARRWFGMAPSTYRATLFQASSRAPLSWK
jgi:AraC-like DNA-binding protein